MVKMFENLSTAGIPALFDTLLNVARSVGDLVRDLLYPVLGEWTTIGMFAIGVGISYGLKDQLRNSALILGGLVFFLLLYRPV